MADLSQKERDRLPDSAFAVPNKRKLPIENAEHLKLAWDMVDRTEGLTPEEREEARRRILRRAKELGVDTSDWNKGDLKAASEMKLHAAASNVLLGNLDHPNRMPFRGILTYFDAPSDEAPGGALGRRVVIPAKVGIPALSSLQGMAVNYSENWDGHNPQEKIGIIEKAWAGEKQPDGSIPVYVEGYIFSYDFPDAAVSIKANQTMLGFSYETANTRLVDGEWNGEPVAIVTELGYFTGASILLKDSAAYKTTAIAAAKDKGGNSMADIQKVLDAIDALKKYVDAKFDEFKKEDEKEDKLEAKEDMDKGEEKDEDKGKGKGKSVKASAEEEVKEAEESEKQDEEKPAEEAADALKAYAEKIEALEKRLEALEAENAELKAAAEEQRKIQASARKSIAHPLMSYVAKYGFDENESYENLMASIEKRDDLSIEQRLAAKIELRDKMLRGKK